MEKKCPKCGNPIPDEAAFCLKCFYSINTANGKNQKKKKKAALLLWFKKHKLNLKAIVAALSFLLIMGICIGAIKSSKAAPKPQTADTTIIVEETYYVPVTEENGIAVTNENGVQVTDVVAVTKVQSVTPSTTQKQGLLDKIFNVNSSNDNNNNNNTSASHNTETGSSTIVETTEKKGFFDQLLDSVLGDRETTSTTEKATTEQHGTTGNTTAPLPATTRPVTTTRPVITTTTPSTTQRPIQSATTQSTTAGTTITTTTNSGSYYFEYEAQYSSNPNGNIKLTKYVGNSSIVTIPSYVDGRKVAAIESDCYK